MIRSFLILMLVFLAGSVAWTQENIVSLSGGYAFGKFQDAETSATGWRINGIYEFNPIGGKISHGISFGVINTSGASETPKANYELTTWPLYYSLKGIFGENNFKAFVKGSMGFHFSSYMRVAPTLEIDTKDSGFYGGASAGVLYYLKENIFLNAEYEWAFMSNTFYKNGMINSVMLGLGIQF